MDEKLDKLAFSFFKLVARYESSLKKTAIFKSRMVGKSLSTGIAS